MSPWMPSLLVMRGLMSSTGPSPTSITTARRSTPICGAASPTPSAWYIVSSMSSSSSASRPSNRSTGRQTFLKQGSSLTRMVLSAMDILSGRAAIVRGPHRPKRPATGAAAHFSLYIIQQSIASVKKVCAFARNTL